MAIETFTSTKTQNDRGMKTDLPFWITPADVLAHIKTTYTDTGKLVETKQISEDGDAITTTKTFIDTAAQVQWNSDPVLQANAVNRKSFNIANNIVEVLA